MNPYHWTVPVDHPAFAGHFPGAPILPGVVLLDTALSVIAEAHPIVLEHCEIASVKFLSPVHPGDALAFHYERLPSGSIRFDIRSTQGTVASGTLIPGTPP